MSGRKRCGVVLQQGTREIINDVDKYFKAEKDHANKILEKLQVAGIKRGPDGSVLMPRESYEAVLESLQNGMKVIERVAAATGMNKNTITLIRQEAEHADGVGANNSELITSVEKTKGKAHLKDTAQEDVVEIMCDPLQDEASPPEESAQLDDVQIVCEPLLDNLCYTGFGSPE